MCYREGVSRYPLHTDITEACQLAMEDVKKALTTGKKPVVKPDRPAPPRFFKPEGAGHFLEPAEVEQAFKDLHQRGNLSAPYSGAQMEVDIIEREKTIRALLCIRSARKWLDEAVMKTVEAMAATPGMEEWAKSLKDLLSVAESLSVLELDRLIAEFANTILARRDLWLRAVQPQPRPGFAADLRAASLMTSGLFGDLKAETVEAEKNKRVSEGLYQVVLDKEQLDKQRAKTRSAQSVGKKSAGKQQPPAKSSGKGGKMAPPPRGRFDQPSGSGQQKAPQQQQQYKQPQQGAPAWKGRGAKAVGPPGT